MAITNKSSKKTLLYFGLPLVAAGMSLLWLIFATWAKSGAAARWVEVPTKILSADLQTSRSTDGGRTYKAVAEYEYAFEGITYRNDRVTFQIGSDSAGPFQENAARELMEFQKSGEPFRCFVDPENPSESVLYRDVRWGLMMVFTLFAVVFGGIGAGLIAAAFGRRSSGDNDAALRSVHPDEPWRWREDWAEGKIHDISGSHAFLPGVAAAVCAAISWPVFFAGWREMAQSGGLDLAVFSLLPLSALALAALSATTWMRERRVGGLTLELATVPGVIGGTLEGVIHVPREIEPPDGFSQHLSCQKTVESGSRSKRTIAWLAQRKVKGEPVPGDGSRLAIPVHFEIPFDQPASSPDHQVTWILKLHSRASGRKFSSRFEVPIFDRSETA